jgi:hypothetical protein
MHILLVEADVKRIAPNLAMLKWATYADQRSDSFQYVIGKKNFLKQTPDLILMSCIFSFYSEEYRQLLVHYKRLFPKARVMVGGAFPTLNPEWFKQNLPFADVHEGIHSDIENLPLKYSIAPWSKKIVGYASRGCTNACKYCAVSKLEGRMRSFPSIRPMIDNGLNEIKDPSGIVLYDNNFTEHEYFDKICDELEEYGLPIDIHGLHVSSFTDHQAERFARLKWGAQHEAGTSYMRFSFDFVGYQAHILRALKLAEKHQIKAGFFCYMLFNWVDSPDDFWKRIVMAQEMTDEVGRTIFLFPQRFEPLDALTRNNYIGAKWDKDLVTGMVRLYTFMHGFLPVTTSHNIFNWIGHTKEEFLDNARKFATVKKFRLEKKNCPPPKVLQM